MQKIEIKNKKYPFKVTLKVLEDFEDKFDKSFSSAENMKIKEMVFLLYEGLKAGALLSDEKFDDYTILELKEQLDISDLTEAMQAVGGDLSSPEDAKK